MVVYHLLSITLALVIDRLIGDPPSWPHPVRWIGSLISWLDRRLNKGNGRVTKGILMLVVIGILTFSITLLIVYGAYQIHVFAGIAAESLIIATAIAGNDLKKAAHRVYQPLKKGDVREARQQVSMIVGRDTDGLNEGEITRATVETVAENISDGITAPLFWALIGGAPLAMMYRAVNTCDSMVGYKNERYGQFGRGSARFDDLLNWLPSRITGFCMIAASSSALVTKKQAAHDLKREARKHPSPNSGWGEAAVALLLNIQLGGTNYYQGIKSERAVMGRADKNLQKEHILDAISIMNRSVALFFILLWLGGGSYAVAFTWF
ncbi:adenosylcobinamide-phosphate synthase [Virgibacillus natechei]|uniref:Cobalamin biosynthesis protein CobD n=1 Tax=Virgibacillus natechei TaxID=1216297 RepID=A0ABS4IGA6_9BACI|nr:adenosylcobinamide-phosphate synthase CbiB [Virgibacillus natechei]MBP1969972.1 adenosylcobinamide-phosphate synthase [Virgibacillus natechei]UZD13368.1 adenosylcobinamide-phosphate synthase CbiB [Virgibacillus natechei]